MKKTSLTCASRVLPILLLLLLWSQSAHAQKGDIAGAEALFQEGRRLMDQGKSEEACPKLEESQRLDPGTGTLWHLARCYQETGRLATAWATFHEVAQEAKRLGESAKVKAALDRATQLEPKLHKLRIEVPDESRVDGLVITRAGAKVGKGAWGAAVPVDMGQVLVEASAPGYESWSKLVEVAGTSQDHKLIVPALEPAKKVIVAPPRKDKKMNTAHERWYHDKLGWAVLATGVVTSAGGAGTFFYAGTLEDEANASGDLGERDRLFDDAHRYEVTGGVLLATGAGIALAGVVLLALAPANGDTEALAFDFTPSFSLGANSAFLGLAKDF